MTGVLLDPNVGCNEVLEYDKPESEYENHEKATARIYNQSYETHFKPIIDKRCKTEWVYALFYGYKESKCWKDCIGVSKSVCDWYLDEEFSKLLVKKPTDIRVIPLAKPPQQKVQKNLQDDIYIHQQRYIVSTLNILIGLDTISGIKTKDNYKEASMCWKYQIFFILSVLGNEVDFQNVLLKTQLDDIKKNNIPEKEGKDIMDRLELFIKYCISNKDTIRSGVSYNAAQAPRIIKTYLETAIQVYEKMIYYK